MAANQFIGIYARPDNPRAVNVALKAYELLSGVYGVEARIDRSLSHMVLGEEVKFFDLKLEAPRKLIVVGGDGTLLRAISLIGYTHNVVIHPIKVGRRGFLFELDAEEGIRKLKEFIEDKYVLEPLRCLQAHLCEEEFCKLLGYSVNDIAILALGSKTITLNVRLTGFPNNILLEGDGLILATPVGSTAYSLSAGGPIVDKRLNAIVLTPVNPIAKQPPLVVHGSTRIDVFIERCGSIVRVILDGQRMFRVPAKRIVRVEYSDKRVYVARYHSVQGGGK